MPSTPALTPPTSLSPPFNPFNCPGSFIFFVDEYTSLRTIHTHIVHYFLPFSTATRLSTKLWSRANKKVGSLDPLENSFPDNRPSTEEEKKNDWAWIWVDGSDKVAAKLQSSTTRHLSLFNLCLASLDSLVLYRTYRLVHFLFDLTDPVLLIALSPCGQTKQRPPNLPFTPTCTSAPSTKSS